MGYLRTLAAMLVLTLALCCQALMADGEPGDFCEPGYEVATTGDWAFLPGTSEILKKAGEEVRFRLQVGDCDCHGTPTIVDGITITDWPFEVFQDQWGYYYSPDPSSVPPDNVNIMKEDGGTVKEYHVTFDDSGYWYHDPDPDPLDIKITWVGVADIKGEENVCMSAGGSNNEQVYSVITNPAGHEDMVTWSVSGASSSHEDQDHNQHVVMPFSSGTVTLTATCGTSSVTKTVCVSVLPDPNETPRSGGGGGGGCSSGGCGSSGIWPAPCMWCPTFQPAPDFGCCDCDDGSCGFSCCGDGANDDDSAEDDSVDELNCGGQYEGFQYTDPQGLQYNSYENALSLGNLTTITRSADGNGVTTGYAVTTASGTTTEYSVPIKPNASSSLGRSRKTSVTDADGRVTTYDRDTNGALLSKVLPNGDTYTFEHSLGGTKVTKVTAPDGTYTMVGYVIDGIAEGKVQSVDKYDSTATLLSETDYTYDGFGRLTSATVNGRVMTYAYNGDTITVIDASADPQIVTTYEYTSNTTMITRRADYPNTSSDDQATTYYFFTRDGKKAYLWKVQDPTGAWTTYGTYVLTGTTVYGTVDEDYKFTSDLDLVGKVFRVKDALNRVTASEYDADTGALVQVTYPDDSTEKYQYYLDGSTKTRWPMAVENVRGNHTFYERPAGARHRVTEVKVAAAGAQAPADWRDYEDWDTVPATKTFDYYTDGDQVGLLAQETVPGIDGTYAYYKKYSYLDGSRLESGPTDVTYRWWNNDSQNPEYVDTHEYTEYDIMGRVLSTTDADTRVISNTYDAQGRQLTTTYGASGPYTESHYDCCTLQWTRDEEGRYTYYAYDNAKRVTDVWTNVTGQSETTPLVHYDYDTFGNVAKVTTRSDSTTTRETSYAYDKNNRVVRIDYPAVSQGQDALAPEEFGYDAVGNLLAKRIVSTIGNKATLYKYDNLNRLTDVYYDANYIGSLSSPTYPTGNGNVHYTYVSGSQLRQTMTDSTGTSSYTYDLQDRLYTYSPGTPTNRQITYSYNNLGQKSDATLRVSGNVVLDMDYLYYANGWLKEIQENSSSIAAYTYDEVGNRKRIDLGNGTYTTYNHAPDPRYFVSEIDHYDPSDQLLGAIVYSDRDQSGNPTSVTYPSGTVGYTYDASNRLDSATGFDYNYDWVGNRLNPPASPNPMVYDATDRLVNWPGMQSFTYYATGSLKEQKNTGGTVQKTWAYTGAELISSVTHNSVLNTPSSSMTWDGDSNRVSFTSSAGGTTEFVYDVMAGIPAAIEENDGDPVYYIREPNGALIARMDGTTTNYYHFDELGSTRMLTSGSGTVTDTYTYDAWGKQIGSTGSTAQPYRYVGRLGYYSHYQDTNLFSQNGYQFLQLGVRFYDVLTGRFTQTDPIMPVASYAYVSANPMKYVDWSGLAKKPVDDPRDPTDCIENVNWRIQLAREKKSRDSSKAWSIFDEEALRCLLLNLLCPPAGAACDLNAYRTLRSTLERLDKEVQAAKKAAISECKACMKKVCDGEPKLCDNKTANDGGPPWDD